ATSCASNSASVRRTRSTYFEADEFSRESMLILKVADPRDRSDVGSPLPAIAPEGGPPALPANTVCARIEARATRSPLLGAQPLNEPRLHLFPRRGAIERLALPMRARAAPQRLA